ncbi:MAG: ATP-binding cassette domain-containing protein [Cyanobacteria bacterium J06627_28]
MCGGRRPVELFSSPSPLDSALSEKRKALQGVALRTVTERSRSDLQTGPTLTFDHFSLTTPDHQKQLIQDLSLSLSPNQSLLIMGESGVGKSSLVRAIAGLWQTGQGTLTCPTSVSFIPQRPYLPKGSLRDVLLYPKCPEQSQLKDSSFYQALEQVNLIHLLKHSLEAPLTQSLSLGEQQRIAFARLLLQPTHYVVLDEATSALDLANEARLYQQLLTHDIVPISIGHRHSLKQFHQQLLTLSADGSWQYETI